MKVNELRNELDKYEKKELKEIIVELYKKIPKSTKEDYGIDDYIINLKKDVSKKEIEFSEYRKQIDYFIECVDEGLYSSPNRIIPKQTRSKWRFVVKKYYKYLSSISPNTDDGKEATKLLSSLFTRLSEGIHYLKFSSWNTFAAIGVAQEDYYDTIIKRILSNGYTENNLNECINLLSVFKDSNWNDYDMYDVFISSLITNDAKELVIELLIKRIDELKDKLNNIKNYNDRYYLIENINQHIKSVLDINILLVEYDRGINYFKKNYIKTKQYEEIETLLFILNNYDLKDEWLKVYNSVKDKTKLCDNINKLYDKYKY